MKLEEQLDYFDRKAEQAYKQRLQQAKRPEHKALVIAGARRRLIEGFDLYGDAMFHRSHAELVEEEMQEDEDGLNWRLARMKQGWPT